MVFNVYKLIFDIRIVVVVDVPDKSEQKVYIKVNDLTLFAVHYIPIC